MADEEKGEDGTVVLGGFWRMVVVMGGGDVGLWLGLGVVGGEVGGG